MHEPVTMPRTRDKGTRNDRWQQEDVVGSSIYCTAPVPGGAASGQIQQRILAPSTNQKVLNRHPLPDNSTECGGQLAEQFDECSAWKSSAEVSRHKDLMSAQRRIFPPAR